MPWPSERRCGQCLSKIFTWWNGATIGTLFTIAKRGVFVGEDEFGNRYYEAKDNSDSYDARKRRWVIYKGYAEPTKIPPDWHGWMHYTFDEPPTRAPLRRRIWGKAAPAEPDRHAWRLAAQGLHRARRRARLGLRRLRGVEAGMIGAGRGERACVA